MQLQSLLSAALCFCAAGLMAADDSIVVHEWGTFTSVAGKDGNAVTWMPLSGPSDLPCFVHRLGHRNVKLTYGTVRMETPVLYFYPPMPMTFSIRVDFSKGRITEWYPKASSVQSLLNEDGWIEWNRVQVSKSSEPLPKEDSASHYYAARSTHSWPLASDGENEKLLFYRGIGFFGVDLKPVVETDEVAIRNDGADIIPLAILFDNHSGRTGYQIVRDLRDPVNIRFSDLAGTTESLRQQLQQELTEAGLYREEAHAMLETWRDSWFEEGTRVIYILPRAIVDTLLPLSIQPAPTRLSRVFVGRVELLSPWMKGEITTALSNGDVSILMKYGRFLNAFLGQMSGGGDELPMCDRARQFIQAAYERAWQECQGNSCGQ